MNNTTIPAPPNWAKDGITETIEDARGNQFATFANYPKEFSILRQIDDCFVRVFSEPVDSKEFVSLVMLHRAHSAFRVAASLAMAGQAVESTVVCRSCLEFTLYGACVVKKPELLEIWLKRNDDESSTKEQKESFKIVKLKPILIDVDSEMSRVWNYFYDETIEFGAHPNPLGVLSSARLTADNKVRRIDSSYLHGDGPLLWFRVRATAQVGLCSLLIFNAVHRGIFESTGVDRIAQGLKPLVDKMFREKVQSRPAAPAA